MYKLTENDKQDINILLSLGNSIIENENKLADLEAKFEKESQEYKNTLESLKSTLAIENSIFSRIGTEREKTLNYVAELDDPMNVLGIDSQIKTLIEKNINISKLIRLRIVNKLYQNSLTNKVDDVNSECKIQGYCMSKNHTMAFDPDSMIKTDMEIENDTYKVIAAFLTKEIDSCSNKDLRTKLIRQKYHLSFINPNLEKELIENNFEISEVYLSSGMFATTERLSPEIYTGLKYTFVEILVENSVNKLANIKKIDLNDKDFNKLVTMLKILLKSAIILDEKNIGLKIKEQLKRQMTIFNISETEGTKMIFDIIDNGQKQIPNIKVLSLELKKES